MKKYRSYILNNFRNIPQLDAVPLERIEEIEVVGNVLPFKTNNYIIEELIDWANVPDDPMFTLTFPRREMLKASQYNKMFAMLRRGSERQIITAEANKIRMALNPHPAGQMKNVPSLNGEKLSGMQHKYSQTVLFFPAQAQTCHAYCTFCFRWPQFTGMDSLKFAMKESSLLVEYLKSHREVTDILFTGGDPLIMNARLLKEYIMPLIDEDLPNVQTIRIGTRALSFWPYRFLSDTDSDELLAVLDKVIASGKNLTIMSHFNHPVELSTEAVRKAVARVRATGAQIRTQSPLLRHINDSPELWAEMWRRQVNLNCIPYYMFIARDTGAKQFFEVPLAEAWSIFRNAYQKVSGVCRTVRGPIMSCMPGKVQILGVADVNDEKVFTLRMIQGRNPGWVALPFFAKYDPHITWFDELKPAFDQKRFFFEDELEEILQQ